MAPLPLAEPTGRYLSFHEREELALLKARGLGVRAIARELGRDPGTISRELRRNAATRGGEPEYRATVAQWKAQTAARRPKPAKLVINARLQEYVQVRLSGQLRRPDGTLAAGPATTWKCLNKPHRSDRRWATAWSPEQISRRLVIDFPDDEDMRISHEAIYQALYIQGRGALQRELVACLRTGRALRGSLSLPPWLPILRDMADRRAVRRHHVEWWVVAAWSSLALMVIAGVTAAAGTF